MFTNNDHLVESRKCFDQSKCIDIRFTNTNLEFKNKVKSEAINDASRTGAKLDEFGTVTMINKLNCRIKLN